MTTEFPGIRHALIGLVDDGRRVVAATGESRRLRVFDLAGGPAETMPGPGGALLLGTHGDTVIFTDRTACWRWTPGTDPERLPHDVAEVDSVTGTRTRRTKEGIAVSRPDGSTVTVPVDLTARLAPGGE